MISHLSVGSNDMDKARKFYCPVLEVLGLHLLRDHGESLDFGAGPFTFSIETPVNGKPATAGNGVHIAFAAETRKIVQDFHDAALANGGIDAGAPGLRPEYDEHYYGAFVLDPDGNKLEAVSFSSQ